MRQYVIDDLRPADYETLKNFLDEKYGVSGIDGIYWIEMQGSPLSFEQSCHNDCQPYFFILEIEKSRVSAEFLVRSRNNMRCTCTGYATEIQRNFIIDSVDGIFSENGIIF